MPLGSTTVTRASRRSRLASRLAARVPPTPPPRTTMRAGMAPHLALRTAKRVWSPWSATSTSSWRALATQAGMSVAEPASVDHTSRTSPTCAWRMAPISDISGPGQAMPRASITRSRSSRSSKAPPCSDEDQLAVGGEREGGHALHVVDHRVKVVLLQAEHVHRQRAGVQVHVAELLGLAEHLAPVLAAAVLLEAPHGLGAIPAGLRRQAVLLGQLAGAEGVQRPVLQQDVHLAADRRRARGQQRRRRQLVVGAREQRNR